MFGNARGSSLPHTLLYLMSRQRLNAIRESSNELQNRYAFEFGGKPRATRNLESMEKLVGESLALMESASELKPVDNELLATLKERYELYRRERENIAAAKAQGPAATEAATLSTRANFVFHIYRRHFAGQSRRSRDLRLLDDMISVLVSIDAGMREVIASGGPDGLQADLDVVNSNLEMYRGEYTMIEAARREGTPSEQASGLATLANSQFEIYQRHFAGRPRLSRRPALLQRVLQTLTETRSGMAALERAGLQEEFNTNNQQIIAQRLSAYTDEANAIAAARQDTTMDGLIAALGAEANDIMEVYTNEFAGQSRQTRDIALLRSLCDRLWEIERQMYDLDRATDDGMNARNLRIVQDNLIMLTKEYDLVEEALRADAPTP